MWNAIVRLNQLIDTFACLIAGRDPTNTARAIAVDNTGKLITKSHGSGDVPLTQVTLGPLGASLLAISPGDLSLYNQQAGNIAFFALVRLALVNGNLRGLPKTVTGYVRFNVAAPTFEIWFEMTPDAGATWYQIYDTYRAVNAGVQNVYYKIDLNSVPYIDYTTIRLAFRSLTAGNNPYEMVICAR